jgi:hypothetical protein
MKTVVDAAVGLGKKLVPPNGNSTEEKRWRWWMSATLVATNLALMTHIAIACGLLPFYPGFAYASDVQEAKSESRANRIESLQWRMFELRVKQCVAIDKGDSPRAFTIQMEVQQEKFHALTNSYHPLPDCLSLK